MDLNLGNTKFNQEYACVDGETYIKVFDTIDKIEKTLKIKVVLKYHKYLKKII